MSKNTCEKCKYYEMGSCVRYPPTMSFGFRVIRGFFRITHIRPDACNWPEVEADDWCGEYKER